MHGLLHRRSPRIGRVRAVNIDDEVEELAARTGATVYLIHYPAGELRKHNAGWAWEALCRPIWIDAATNRSVRATGGDPEEALYKLRLAIVAEGETALEYARRTATAVAVKLSALESFLSGESGTSGYEQGGA